MPKSCTALVLAALAACASATVLTPDNFDEATAGKTVFLKMYAPWCGHCKRMKPHWDKLMEEYEGHATILIGDVDCTAEGKPICDANGVRGFPTVKHGDPNNLQDYEGGREFDDLASFAKALKPACSPANDEHCDEKQKAELDALLKLSVEDLEKGVKDGEKSLEDAEETFKTEVEKLQAKYEKLQAEKDTTIKEVNDSGLGMKKTVLAHKKKGSKSEL